MDLFKNILFAFSVSFYHAVCKNEIGKKEINLNGRNCGTTNKERSIA